jgi:hypothetical protein
MTMRYLIGGQLVEMSETQAAHWNCGNATAKNMRGATIYLPSRYGCRSYVRDGEVIVEDGLPTGEWVGLWTIVRDANYYREFLEDNPAELTT